MSSRPQVSMAVWTSASGTPSSVRSPACDVCSPGSEPADAREVRVEVVDHDVRAVLGQQLRRGEADAAP
jgi:hypothetical protein